MNMKYPAIAVTFKSIFRSGVEYIARRLGVQAVATEYDREYGVFLNNLMAAKEKARYIIDHGLPVIENFYSHSLADTPIALCAEKAHLVTDKAQKVVDWPDMNRETMDIWSDRAPPTIHGRHV